MSNLNKKKCIFWGDISPIFAPARLKWTIGHESTYEGLLESVEFPDIDFDITKPITFKNFRFPDLVVTQNILFDFLIFFINSFIYFA